MLRNLSIHYSQVLRERDSFHVEVLLRFGAWKGCIVEFSVESDVQSSSMKLIFEGWCSFTCLVKKPENSHEDLFIVLRM